MHNPDDVLAAYTEDIIRYDVLTREEEEILGARAVNGDHEAQNALVQANLRFVVRVAKRYKDRGVPFMDLIQAGNIGMHQAAERFNPEHGVRFITYAIWWCRQAILKEIDSTHASVRATNQQQVRIRRVRKLQGEAEQKLGRPYTPEELQEITGYHPDRIKEALEYRVTMHSFDSPLPGSDDDATPLAEVLPTFEDPEERELDRERASRLSLVLAEVLTDRERRIVEAYFGIGGRRRQSLNEIGDFLGISRERARQLKERALRKLQDSTAHHPFLLEVFTTQETMDRLSGRTSESTVIEQIDEMGLADDEMALTREGEQVCMF